MILPTSQIPINELDVYIRLAKSNNLSARNALILKNGRLVVSMAKTYAKTHKVPMGTLDDLIQEGLAIIPKAIEKYEFGHSCTFISYLQYWILNAFNTYVRNNRSLVHLPMNLVDLAKKIDSFKGNRRKTIEYANSIKVIAETFVNPEGKVESIFNTIPSRSLSDLDESVDFEKFNLLSNEEDILNLIINENYTLRDIANIRNVSAERIRQIARRARTKVAIKLDDKILSYLGTPLKLFMDNDETKVQEFKECYVLSHKSGIIRANVKLKSSKVKYKPLIWIDTEGNEYDIAYRIPYEHFNKKKLIQVYNNLIKRLESRDIRYIFYSSGCSDNWKLTFDAYCITLVVKDNESVMRFSSFIQDIETKYYRVNETEDLYKDIIKVARGL